MERKIEFISLFGVLWERRSCLKGGEAWGRREGATGEAKEPSLWSPLPRECPHGDFWKVWSSELFYGIRGYVGLTRETITPTFLYSLPLPPLVPLSSVVLYHWKLWLISFWWLLCGFHPSCAANHMFDLGQVIFPSPGSNFLTCKTEMIIPTLHVCFEN